MSNLGSLLILGVCLFLLIELGSCRKSLKNAELEDADTSQKESPQQSRSVTKSALKQLKIGVQGAEMFAGQRKPGVELGPKVIRETEFIPALQSMGHDVLDYGNIPTMEVQGVGHLQMAPTTSGTVEGRGAHRSKKSRGKKTRNVKQVAAASKLISDWTTKILQDGRISLTLGGDHALGIGSVHGASQAHPDLAVLWIDAHADTNTPLTSRTGNIHGMPVAFLVKELQPYVTQFPEFASWIKPLIPASNLAYIGLRDVGSAEATIFEMFNIAAYSMRDVDRYGISKVAEMALERISSRNKSSPIHVSFDIDSICDSVVKSTGTPVAGGLTLREGITLMEIVHQTGRLVSMDLVEVNPLLGTANDAEYTARAAKHIILSAFGYERGGAALNSIPKPK